MKTIFIIAFLFVSYNSFAQSKGDTQAWIKGAIQNYASKASYQVLNINYQCEELLVVLFLQAYLI